MATAGIDWEKSDINAKMGTTFFPICFPFIFSSYICGFLHRDPYVRIQRKRILQPHSPGSGLHRSSPWGTHASRRNREGILFFAVPLSPDFYVHYRGNFISIHTEAPSGASSASAFPACGQTDYGNRSGSRFRKRGIVRAGFPDKIWNVGECISQELQNGKQELERSGKSGKVSCSTDIHSTFKETFHEKHEFHHG